MHKAFSISVSPEGDGVVEFNVRDLRQVDLELLNSGINLDRQISGGKLRGICKRLIFPGRSWKPDSVDRVKARLTELGYEVKQF